MTDLYGGYQPPRAAAGPSSSGAAAETAKHQAAGVASTTAEQTRNIAAETRTQARNLMNETRSQVNEQAAAQKDKASGGLRSLADELRSMAGHSQQSGIASELARQAAVKAQDLAGWLDGRQPGDLVNEVRELARRRPGTFLLGAAAAGVLAGRLTRSAVDIKRGEGDQMATRDVSIGGYPVSPGSEWANATGGTAAGQPTEGLAVESESTPLAAEAYETATGQSTGNDRL